MPNVNIYDMSGKVVADIALSDAVFGIEPNGVVMHAAVVNYLANQRQGTQSALTRSEVSGGGKKPWRQNRSQRRRPQTLETERHRPRETGLHQSSPVETRRRCFGPETP